MILQYLEDKLMANSQILEPPTTQNEHSQIIRAVKFNPENSTKTIYLNHSMFFLISPHRAMAKSLQKNERGCHGAVDVALGNVGGYLHADPRNPHSPTAGGLHLPFAFPELT
jgi:hypothetical protein